MHHHLADELLGVGIVYTGTDRDPDPKTLALVPGHLAAHAILSTLGPMVPFVAEIHQGVESAVSNQVHVTAIAPVTAIGAAFGNIFLTTKTDAAVTAVTRLYLDHCLIDELHRNSPQTRNAGISRAATKKAPSRATRPFLTLRLGSLTDQAGSTLTNFRLVAPLVSKRTTPSDFANKV
jgi:hypothetical protein